MSIVFYLNTGGLITTNMQFFVYMAEENNGIMRDFGQNNKNIEFLNIKEELLIYVKCSLKVLTKGDKAYKFAHVDSNSNSKIPVSECFLARIFLQVQIYFLSLCCLL